MAKRQENAIRSDERIPKLRARGRANRRKLLAEAERLLLERTTQKLRFSDVFEAAGVSRGSAYRIYIGIDDLIQDLGAEWINNFCDTLRLNAPLQAPTSWMELSDYIVTCGAQYWADTEQTMKALPRIRANAPASYRNAMKAMTQTVAELFDRFFVIPDIPDWHLVIGFYAQLGDLVYSDAVRRDGHISESRLVESQTLCRTYLSFYLPDSIPRRDSAQA